MYQHLVRFRSLLRAAGVTTLVGKIRAFQQAKLRKAYQEEYARTAPSTVEIGDPGCHASLKDLDRDHYVSLRLPREPAVFKFMTERWQPRVCFWDVGANIGYYTMLAASAVGPLGKVVAFEPHPQAHEQLLENIALNGATHVKAVPMALGRARGELPLVLEGATISGAHHLCLDQASPQASGGVVQMVQVLTGDEWWHDSQLPPPQMIKIDVEGAELEVLEGMKEVLRQPACHTVIVEVHFKLLADRGLPDAPRAIMELLRGSQFNKMRWLDPSHLAACKVTT